MAENKIASVMNLPRQKILLPLGLKLTVIVTLILLGSIWAITSMLSLMVSSEFVRTAEDTNFAINSRAASGIEERLYKMRSESLLLLDMNSAEGNNFSMALQFRNIFFERNPDIAAVFVPGSEEIINRQFFTNNEISPDVLNDWLASETGATEQAKENVPVLCNVVHELGINLLALFYPWQNKGYKELMVVFFSPQSLSEITAAGSSSTMVVNGDGDVLIHPDFNQVISGANVSGSSYFDALKKEPGESVRISYTEGKNRFVAAGHRISFADVAVFSTLEYSFITKKLAVVSRRSIMLSVTILFLSILVTWFFSKSITNSLKKLTAAAGRIKTGEFYLDLKPDSWDELGALTEEFIEMGHGLTQWEEMRDLLGHYNNREIINKAMKGELNLTGEYLQAVILSVDYISFSSVAGELDAQASLSLLNSFIAKVINCVERADGVVDKIVGSRIIALWGIPFSTLNLAGEVMNSLRSAMMMRNLITEFNSGKEDSNQPLLRMSCGIHVGEVLAGRIGAFRFNKYSVIGKNIDTAILCGKACALADTDIIISKAVLDLVADQIVTEEVSQDKIGNGELTMFRVVDFASSDKV